MALKRLWVLCMAAVLAFPFGEPAQARRIKPEDVGYEILKSHERVTVHMDGKREYFYQNRFKVISEVGIGTFNSYDLPYNSKSEIVTVHHMRVQNADKTHQVDIKNIEDRAMYSGATGYDETRTKIIPLPNIQVGSVIDVEYGYQSNRPPYPNVISTRLYLSEPHNIADYQKEIIYPRSVKMYLHDATGFYRQRLTTAREGESVLMSFKIQNYPGVGVKNETRSLGNPKEEAWVDLTNVASYEAGAQVAGQGYERVLEQELPERLAKLFGPKPEAKLDEVQAKSQLQGILDRLTEDFRYFSDWRSVDGEYVPRPLKDVDRTGYGDCKDFAILVTKAARHLGLKAEVVLVYSDYNPPIPGPIPNINLYNHAIVRIQVPGKSEYWWVDGTRKIPNLGIVPEDIAGRQVLIVGPKGGKFEIPAENGSKNQEEILFVSDPRHSSNNIIETKISLKGLPAWGTIWSLKGLSRSNVEDYLKGYVGVSNADLSKFDLMERETSALDPFSARFHMKMTQKNGFDRAGDLKILPIVQFESAPFGIMSVMPEDRLTDMALGAKGTVTVLHQLATGSYAEIVGAPKSCDIQSPWFTYQRKIIHQPTFQIRDTARVVKSRIRFEEIKSPAFAELQQQLRDCLLGVVTVVK